MQHHIEASKKSRALKATFHAVVVTERLLKDHGEGEQGRLILLLLVKFSRNSLISGP